MATPFAPPQPVSLPPRGNGLAIAGFVVALVGLVLCWVPVIGWLLCLVGVVLSAIGWSGAKKAAGKNKGMAIAGVICGAVGLVVGVVFFVITMISFNRYVDKSVNRGDAQIHLRSIQRGIEMHYIETNALPPSSTRDLPGPDGSACAGGGSFQGDKAPWAEDPAWKAIDFTVYGTTRFTYHWVKKSETSGRITAVSDLDCDGTLGTEAIDIEVVDGMVRGTRLDATPD